MNNKEYIAELAQRTGYSREDTQRMVRVVVEAVAQRLENGEGVAVAGFGLFEPKKRTERIVVNPSTGKRMLVPPKIVVGFKTAATIKEKIKTGGVDNG